MEEQNSLCSVKSVLECMEERHTLLSTDVIHTPIVECISEVLSEALDGGRIYLKLECSQKTGSFKARGVLSVATQLSESDVARGLTTASAGNHAIALSWAARTLGVSAKVVMPRSASNYRIQKAKGYGAEVVLTADVGEVFATAKRFAEDEGRYFVHPFEGIDTTLGTAGVGIEMLRDCPQLDVIVGAIGGGGLMSGLATAVKLMKPSCLVFGVEPIGAACMSKSIKAGRACELEAIDTIADSLAPPMSLPFSYSLCAANLDEIVTVTDDEICAATCIMLEEGKLAVEPAAAAPLAALLSPLREKLKGMNVGILVCGSNLSGDDFTRIIQRGSPHAEEFARNGTCPGRKV